MSCLSLHTVRSIRTALLFLLRILFLILLFVCLQGRGLIAELLEGINECCRRGLVGVVGDGDALLVNVGLNGLDTLLKAKVPLDFCLAEVAAGRLQQFGTRDDGGKNLR